MAHSSVPSIVQLKEAPERCSGTFHLPSTAESCEGHMYPRVPGAALGLHQSGKWSHSTLSPLDSLPTFLSQDVCPYAIHLFSGEVLLAHFLQNYLQNPSPQNFLSCLSNF